MPPELMGLKSQLTSLAGGATGAVTKRDLVSGAVGTVDGVVGTATGTVDQVAGPITTPVKDIAGGAVTTVEGAATQVAGPVMGGK